MIYTRDLLLRSLRNVDEPTHCRILNQEIGIPQAVTDAASHIVLNIELGDYGYTHATRGGMREYTASIRVIACALYELKRAGTLSYGSQAEFTERELSYGTHICHMFTIPEC